MSDITTKQRIEANINYTDTWWSTTARLLSFFSYSERFHTQTALSLIKKIKKGDCLLDIGIGSGSLLKKAATMVPTVIGLDISINTIRNILLYRKANSTISLVPIDPYRSDLSFKDNSFDIIFCNHVLEHVTDDTFLVSELFRVLKNNGHAVIMVPINEEHLDVPNHVRKYTSESIRQCVQNSFEIIDSGSNDLVSTYIRIFGVKKGVIRMTLKKMIILFFSFVPSPLALRMDTFLGSLLKDPKKNAQSFLLLKKVER